MVVKATRAEVKHNNELAKEQKKENGSREKVKPIKVIYQIIPWEYYSPDEYEVVAYDAGKGKNGIPLKLEIRNLRNLKAERYTTCSKHIRK